MNPQRAHLRHYVSDQLLCRRGLSKGQTHDTEQRPGTRDLACAGPLWATHVDRLTTQLVRPVQGPGSVTDDGRIGSFVAI